MEVPEMTIPLQRNPVKASGIKLEGKIGNLLDRFCFERARSQEAWNIACREAVDAFKNKIDDESGLIGIWQGEFWGKWILSAVDVYEYTGDDALKYFIRSSIAEVISYQEPSGYIGTYRDPDFLVHGDPEEIYKKFNWRCDWNWNIWCRKYTLWALVEGARILNDPEILKAAVRLADQTLDTFERLHIEIWETGTFCGLPSCSIMKPLLQLYQLTGTERYLKLAQKIASYWNNPDDTVMPNLIRNSLAHKPVHAWYDHSCGKIWTKTYEMISCFEGLLELYRITGEEQLLTATEAFWELLMEHEKNVFFGLGCNDNLNHGAIYQDAITEPCDNIHFIRLCHELYKLTGKVRYMDFFELNFLNAFLAGLCKDGRWGARGVRSSHCHFYDTAQAKMHHNHCCVNNMPRGIVTAARTALMTGADGIYVNLCVPQTADLERNGVKIHLRIAGDYLVSGKVSIEVAPEKETDGKLFIRLPEWSDGRRACLDGKPVQSGENGYLELPLAETTCLLQFNMTSRITGTGPITVMDPNDRWHGRRWLNSDLTPEDMLKTPHCSIMRGPLLLARSILLGTPVQEIFAPDSLEPSAAEFQPIENAMDTLAAFEVTFQTPHGKFRTKVCDFASAGNWMSDYHDIFSVYF